MLGLVILLTVTMLSINDVKCDPLRDIDVDNILQALQRQMSEEQYQSKPRQGEERSGHDNNDSEDNSNYGSLQSTDIIELIQKASRDSYKDRENSRNTKDNGIVIRYNQLASTLNDDNDDISDRDNDRSEHEQMLDAILLKFLKQKKFQQIPRKVATTQTRLAPNNLLRHFKRTDKDRLESINNLGDYSKIYVILNPLAIRNSKNKNNLNELLSKVLSMSSSHNQMQYEDRKKDYRYKGFPVKRDVLSRRVRRDSKEMYAPKDTIEDDYKQKRARNERGGGNAGRTAIPYIRHRGDIYERDN